MQPLVIVDAKSGSIGIDPGTLNKELIANANELIKERDTVTLLDWLKETNLKENLTKGNKPSILVPPHVTYHAKVGSSWEEYTILQLMSAHNRDEKVSFENPLAKDGSLKDEYTNETSTMLYTGGEGYGFGIGLLGNRWKIFCETNNLPIIKGALPDISRKQGTKEEVTYKNGKLTVTYTVAEKYRGTQLEQVISRLDKIKLTEYEESVVYNPNTKKFYILPAAHEWVKSELEDRIAGTLHKNEGILNKRDKSLVVNYLMEYGKQATAVINTSSLAIKSATASYDIAREQLTLHYPMQRPIRPAFDNPKDYTNIMAIWKKRFQLDALAYHMVGKGYGISGKYNKKSLLVFSLVTNWGKTTQLAAALIEIGAATIVNFNNMVSTLETTTGSESFKEAKYTKTMLWIFDEFKDALNNNKITDADIAAALKKLADPFITGTAKNEKAVTVRTVLNMFLLADDIMSDFKDVLGDPQIGKNRLMMPDATGNEMGIDFPEYNEEDTKHALSWYFYEKINDYIALLDNMSHDERMEWYDKVPWEQTKFNPVRYSQEMQYEVAYAGYSLLSQFVGCSWQPFVNPFNHIDYSEEGDDKDNHDKHTGLKKCVLGRRNNLPGLAISSISNSDSALMSYTRLFLGRGKLNFRIKAAVDNKKIPGLEIFDKLHKIIYEDEQPYIDSNGKLPQANAWAFYYLDVRTWRMAYDELLDTYIKSDEAKKAIADKNIYYFIHEAAQVSWDKFKLISVYNALIAKLLYEWDKPIPIEESVIIDEEEVIDVSF